MFVIKYILFSFVTVMPKFSTNTAMAPSKVNVTVKSIEYCKNIDKSIITVFVNVTFRVTDFFEVFVKSCSFSMPYNKAILELKFYKGKTRLYMEKVDLCNPDKKRKEMTQLILDAFGIAFGCPVTKNTTFGCNEERKLRVFSIMSQRSIRTVLGGVPEPLKCKIDIEHDTGRSCFIIDVLYSGIPSRGNSTLWVN